MRYTVAEIDEMREAISYQLYGRIWTTDENEKDRMRETVERRLRTYMQNGTRPEELMAVASEPNAVDARTQTPGETLNRLRAHVMNTDYAVDARGTWNNAIDAAKRAVEDAPVFTMANENRDAEILGVLNVCSDAVAALRKKG